MTSLSGFVDLRSDTVTTPTPAMRRAMAQAEVGDDGYGEDPTVRALEEAYAQRVGKEAGLYVASGTMANQIALLVLSRPGDVVVAGRRQHVVRAARVVSERLRAPASHENAAGGINFLEHRGFVHGEMLWREAIHESDSVTAVSGQKDCTVFHECAARQIRLGQFIELPVDLFCHCTPERRRSGQSESFF